jgi:two-component system chemotaxis response regulator CheY
MFPVESKIIFCDDMRVIRETVRRNLIELGYRNLSSFVDAAEAWPAVVEAVKAKEPYQLIISDWNMPGMKGIDFLKNVRSLPEMKDVPFFLLTAENEINQILEAKAAGVTDYILKPFTAANLQEKLFRAYLRAKKNKAAKAG